MHGYYIVTRIISSCPLVTVSTTEWRDSKEGAMYIEASSISWSSLRDSLSGCFRLLLGVGLSSGLGTECTIGVENNVITMSQIVYHYISY